MAHNRSEKEETLELHIPLCPPDNCKISPPQICPGSGSDPDRFDPGVSGSERLPEKKDLVADTRKRGSVCGGGGEEEREGEKKAVNRCWGCKKRVGLTGFRCRCGELFCAVHRYSDRHDCSFDYKTAAREAIARENPVVRAAKILKV